MLPKISFRLLVILCALLALGAPVVAKPSPPVRIAIAGPASGPQSDQMAVMVETARLFANVVNARGGILNRNIDIMIRDDGCAGEVAKSVAHELTEQKIELVIGHPCTRASLQAADIYAPSQTLFMATATRHPSLTRKRSEGIVLRVAGRDDRQGESAAIALTQLAKGKRLAVVHDRTLYARKLARTAVQTLKKLNAATPGIDLTTATIIAGDKDYKKLLAKLRGADAIFFAGFPLEAGLIYQQLRASGSKAVFLGSDTTATSEFVETFRATGKGYHALISTTSALGIVFNATKNEKLNYLSPELEAIASATEAALRAYTNAARQRNALARSDIVSELTAAPSAEKIENNKLSFTKSGDARTASFRIVRFDGDRWLPIDMAITPISSEQSTADPKAKKLGHQGSP